MILVQHFVILDSQLDKQRSGIPLQTHFESRRR